MRSILLIFFLLLSLGANEEEYNEEDLHNEETHQEKVLYIQLDEKPSRIIKGEIFPITVRVLSTTDDFSDLEYNFSKGSGIAKLNTIPYRIKEKNYYYDTFYFTANYTGVSLPDIEVSLISASDIEYKAAKLKGTKLNVVALNPKKNFSNIIANAFVVSDYKTTSFDNNYNIIVFVAEATNCNIKKLKLNNVYKQGTESSSNTIEYSKITYFVVIDKKIENFKFTYFNLLENNFNTISIPIVVDDDSVTTQSDLKPRDQSKEKIKMITAIVVAVVLLIFILLRKKYIYSILLIFPITYSIYVAIPSEEICIRIGSNISLLPVSNGTIFETTKKIIYLRSEGEVDKYHKIKLSNNKIGWVKNEDLCKY